MTEILGVGPQMTEMYAAFVGAVVGGLLTLAGGMLLTLLERRKLNQSLKAALSTEISVILELARRRGYAAHLRRLADLSRSQDPGSTPPRFAAHIGDGYFTVFEANAGNVGCLETAHVIRIIAFYQHARSWLDGIHYITECELKPADCGAAADFYEMLADLLERIDRLGNSITADLAPPAARGLIEQTVESLDAAA